MSRLPRNEGKSAAGKYSMEFTTGQLVVISCVLLFMCMVLFAMGLLVGRVDTPLDPAPIETAQQPPDTPTESYTIPAFGQQAPPETAPAAAITPEATPVPVVDAQPSAAQRTPENPPTRSPYMENKPRLTALPPLSAQRPTTAPQVEAPARPPRPAEGENAPAAPPATAPAAPPATAPAAPPATAPAAPPATAPATPPQTPVLQPIDPVEPAMPVKVSPQPTQETVKPKAGAKDPGKFGVQLAAFSGSDRRTRAEGFQRRVREQLKVDAEIIPSSDDVHYRVVVVGFASREAANAACAELRGKAGLSEAFVRPL